MEEWTVASRAVEVAVETEYASASAGGSKGGSGRAKAVVGTSGVAATVAMRQRRGEVTGEQWPRKQR